KTACVALLFCRSLAPGNPGTPPAGCGKKHMARSRVGLPAMLVGFMPQVRPKRKAKSGSLAGAGVQRPKRCHVFVARALHRGEGGLGGSALTGAHLRDA